MEQWGSKSAWPDRLRLPISASGEATKHSDNKEETAKALNLLKKQQREETRKLQNQW